DPPRGSGSAPRRAPDVAGRAVVPVPSLARSFAGSLDTLQGPAIAVLPGDVRVVFYRARLPRAAARGGNVRPAGAILRGVLLRVLLANAVLYAARAREVAARAVDASLRNSYQKGFARARRHAAGL